MTNIRCALGRRNAKWESNGLDFREQGGDTLDNYEDEIRGKKGMNREIHRLFATLQGKAMVMIF